MNAIFVLCLLLLLSLLLIAGGPGLRTFLALAINFCLIFALIILINWGFSPYAVTAVIAVMILAVAIFLSGSRGRVMAIAWKTSLLVLVITAALAVLVQWLAQVQGYTLENSDELEGLSLNIGLSFTALPVVVMVVSALGAVAEAAMAVTADLFEVVERSPEIQPAALRQQGQLIGGQILGTAVNTLFFGMLGANMPLLIWYLRLHYSWATLLNAKLLLMEIFSTVLGMIGILLAIWLAEGFVVKAYQQEGRKILDETDL
ncbi:YibE/F family protein [Leuconostocaceae bacterium ESL0958]|nr:YibE/F family protein [Leuconostocaceae bacterium ESL0958]